VIRFYPFPTFKLETNSALPTTAKTHQVNPYGGDLPEFLYQVQ
jgi:hypothetical protein